MRTQTNKGKNRFTRNKIKENESLAAAWRQNKSQFTLEEIKMVHYKGRDNNPDTETLVIYRDDQIVSTYINGILQNLNEEENKDKDNAATRDVKEDTTPKVTSPSKPKTGKKASASAMLASSYFCAA